MLKRTLPESCEWIERYFEHPERIACCRTLQPGEMSARRCPLQAPEAGEPFDADLRRFRAHHRSRHHALESSALLCLLCDERRRRSPSLAEALAATLDVKAMLWRTSPAATELEQVTMRWLAPVARPAAGLWTGIIYDTASIAGFTALAAAREALDLDIRDAAWRAASSRACAFTLPSIRIRTSKRPQLRSGSGNDNVVRVAMRRGVSHASPRRSRRHIEDDIAAGMRPLAVVATVGTTSTTSVDPVRDDRGDRACSTAGVAARRCGLCGTLPRFCPSFAGLLDGVERADSLVVNPHKWMFVPMDLSVLFVKDEAASDARSAWCRTISRRPKPMRSTIWTTGCSSGRRFRALKLWFVLRHFGAEGIRSKLRAHIELAASVCGVGCRANRIGNCVAPHPFSVVCFRYSPAACPTTAA